MHIKCIWINVLLFLLVALPFGCSRVEVEDEGIPLTEQEIKWLVAHPVIRLAPDPYYPPIEYFDENGEYRGVTADYIELISQKLGIHFEIVHLRNWDEAIEKAKSRQIDMLGAATKTPRRTEYMLFTFPYIDFPSAIIVEKSVEGTLTIEKISGMKVAVVSGYADHELIAYNYPELDFVLVPDIQTGLKQVSFGMVDAFVTQLATATYYIEKEGITNLRIAGETDYEIRLAFASRNDWPELNLILEKGLAQISEEERQAIYKKWVRLEQEPLLARKDFWLPVLGSLGVVILIIAGFIAWNRSLRRQVNRRTEEVQNELAQRKKMEEETAKFKYIADSAAYGVVIRSHDGTLVYVNEFLAIMHGYTRDELIGQHYSILFNDEQKAAIDKATGGFENIGNFVNQEIWHTRKDGTIFPTLVTGSVLKDESGKSLFMASTTIDITERKQAEEEIAKFKTIVDQAGYGVALSNLEGKFTYINEFWARMHGYTIDELIGKDSSLLQTEATLIELNKFRTKLLREGTFLTEELWRKRKDGIVFPSFMTAGVIKDDKGNPLYFAATAIDITERKKTEQEITKFKTIADAAPYGVVIGDPDNIIMYVNATFADWHGYKIDELIGKSLSILFTEDQYKTLTERHKKILRTGEVISAEIWRKKRDGTVFSTLSSGSLVKDNKGRPLYFAATHFDLTERKKTEEELLALNEQLNQLNLSLERKVKERTNELEIAIEEARTANKSKSDFLASMSHELRTPLNAVIGFSQVLQEQYFGELNEKQTEYVTDINESGQHLLSLINDILDLSKIEAGKMELELSDVKIKELIENSLVMIKEKALVHGIRLDIQCSKELEGLQIMADERKLKQVMFNLLSNAAKFTPDGGSITIKGWKEGELLNISVEDTGIGLAPEDQEKVFGEFYQVQSSLTNKTPGTGLGLPLTRSIMEMHNGKIWVESDGENKGSRFTFNLPV